MNNYFTLRKTNRLRIKLLTKTTQEQIKEVIRYLRRISWDVCGVELVYSDMIDIAVRANEEGKELFSVISDAETFVNEVKSGLKRLNWFDFFTMAIPVFLFFGWGIEGVMLNPLILSVKPDYKYELSLGYLIQFCICAASAFYLFRHMMEQVGFPPCRHQLKFIVCLLLYVLVLYGTGELLHGLFGNIVFARLAPWSLTFACLLIGVILLVIRYDRYGKDERLKERI